jgi:two-component system response regulator HydG
MVEGKSVLLALLQEAQHNRFPLIFVVPGSGQIARYAIEGGAHFLMVLNAGIYRMAGVSSLGSLLPFGNANDQTENLLRTQIFTRSHRVPVVAGMLASDPVLHYRMRFKRLQELGVAGITNWPAANFIDGCYREALAEEGFTSEAEIQMLIEARRFGFVTFGFAVTKEDAAAMASAGVDALVLNAGWTHEIHNIYERGDRIQYAISKTNEMLSAVKTTGCHLPAFFFGGSITTPEETAELYRRTGVHGYGGGSAFEKIPIARLMIGTIKQFCAVPRHMETDSVDKTRDELLGTTSAMLKLYKLIERVAPQDVSVCIEGESGVGKELVAVRLHRLSHRSPQPFITLNCGAIPETLLESELFGHEKGSFTGAVSRKIGKIELANQGTLFLDEVAELSPKAQVSLLRVIQQKEITRIGGEKPVPVNVRIITATHQNLKSLVDEGKFRADLYFRLNMITLKIPPLRDRKQDIPLLVEQFIQEQGAQFGRRVIGITPNFERRLMEHSWPGNVRELQHVLTRAILLEDGSVLEGEDFLPETTADHDPSAPMHEPASFAPGEADKQILLNTIKATGGNKAKAARILGISRKTLYARLERYAIA